jgi:hypothetical protein
MSDSDQKVAAPMSDEDRVAAYREEIARLESLLQAEWDAAGNRVVVACEDCERAYGDEGWIECIVPDDVWRQISTTHDDGGILCISCISRRIKRLGLSNVPVMLCGTEAICAAGQSEAFDRGWNAAKNRIEELEGELSSLRAQLEKERRGMDQEKSTASTTDAKESS